MNLRKLIWTAEEGGNTMGEEKQMEMKLPFIYPVEKMGTLMLPHAIYLFESFIRDKLKASMLDGRPGWDRKKITNIGCPFCKKGSLELVNVEPTYSGGMHPTPRSMEHVGNKYEYICSNDDCDGRFIGTHQWAYID